MDHRANAQTDADQNAGTASAPAHGPGGAGRLSRRHVIAGAALGAAGIVGQRVAEAAVGSSIGTGARVTEQAVRIDPPTPVFPGAYVPGNLYVGLYGLPGSSSLGALGEQSVEASIERARQVASEYEGFGRPVVPAFEIIASVAAADAGGDGDYSNEFGLERFGAHIEAAQRNDFHVVIDLQSGRSPFDEQVREYEDALSYPHVSLALDPEWRFDAPGRPGGGRVGTVDASEVNATIAWLDDLVVRKNLPAKLVVLHQFTPSMVTNKAAISGTANLQVVMHMDGFGSLALKRGSYGRMIADLPPGALTGWKNFFDEDRPTPTARQTLDNPPNPMLVSYQ